MGVFDFEKMAVFDGKKIGRNRDTLKHHQLTIHTFFEMLSLVSYVTYLFHKRIAILQGSLDT